MRLLIRMALVLCLALFLISSSFAANDDKKTLPKDSEATTTPTATKDADAATSAPAAKPAQPATPAKPASNPKLQAKTSAPTNRE